MDDFEARILTIELIDTWVVCCYAPATGDDLKRAYRVNTWNPAFGNYLERLKATGKSVIFSAFTLRSIQTGRVYNYALGIVLGILFILVAVGLSHI